jgi:hypothetical protein
MLVQLMRMKLGCDWMDSEAAAAVIWTCGSVYPRSLTLASSPQ